MNSNLQYNGKVTIKFYNKEGKLKGTHIQYNHGTPYLFSVFEKILSIGTSSIQDDRPGRIMLTSPGYIEKDGNNLILYNGSYTDDGTNKKYSKETGNAKLLSSNISRVSTPLTTQKDSPLYNSNGNLIPPYNPCIRYEFNISYYDLINSTPGENDTIISSLDRYRLWLLSYDDTTFKISNNGVYVVVDPDNNKPDISDITASGGDVEETDEDTLMECLLNNITYANVENVSKICAQTQIKKIDEGGTEIDYSLNEGEYITVLWDMYFENNPVSEVNE